MDGFCDNAYSTPCFPYSYVVNSPNTTDVAPYFSIASHYGFANYMFQTNEGPSYAAHQFLFTGTSAPVAVNTSNDYYKYFVVNNPSNTNGTGGLSGCPQLVDLSWIDPTRGVAAGLGGNYECYPHDCLVTSATCQNNTNLCDKSTTLFSTWRYYAPEPGSIWDAPEAIPEVCYGVNDLTNAGRSCGAGSNTYNNGNWLRHMSFYSTMNNAPIFSDIQNCNLANISWVIPDSAWSDHPNSGTGTAFGPYWVANIVNAIGNSYVNTHVNGNTGCDYWGNVAPSGSSARKPTAIFIVWDDWGGFYDHVAPKNAYLGAGTEGGGFTCNNAPNGWGCGYIYGFRVPFLVVSEYTGSTSGGGYISGPCTPPSCPNTTQKYQHDFGSILAFTEFNFGLGPIDQSGNHGYADANALDAVNLNIPLSDFFPLCTTTCTGRSFFPIPVSPYPASFFENYYTTHSATPAGPDPD